MKALEILSAELLSPLLLDDQACADDTILRADCDDEQEAEC
jgi:hypothetical protein